MSDREREREAAPKEDVPEAPHNMTDPGWSNTNAVRTDVAATGATAGIPGSFTPDGATAPATLTAMTDLVATPATPWTTGQHVVLGDASRCCWSGVHWVGGLAP